MMFVRVFVLGLAALTAASCASPRPAATQASGAREAPAPRRVVFLHTADTHAQLETHPEYLPGATPPLQAMGGYARLRAAIEREQKAAGSAFVVDGGDTFQGSGPAAWTEGEAVLEPFNALGVDVCVPGNWEVVYGADRFRDLMNRVSCKVTAYNFHDKASGARLFAPSVTLERSGVRVTFVGITDPTTTLRQPPAQVVGLDSTRLDGLRAYVASLRAAERADLVVAVTHTGLTVSRQIAREIPELDVVLSGHTHERTEGAIREGKVIVVEPGSMGSFLGRLEVTLGPNGGVAAHDFKLIPVRADDYPEDPAVKSIVDRVLAPHRARMGEVLGETKTTLLRYDMLETTADDFIADALRETGHADIGLTNGFRFTPPIPPGPLTEGDLWQLLPLDARTKRGTATGKQLHDYLESELELVFSRDPWKLSGGWGPRASGLSFVFRAHAAPGERVQQITIGGRPLEPSRQYSLAGCERAGEPLDVICRMRGTEDVTVLPQTIHGALREYLRKHPVVAPRREGRAVAVDLAPTVFSQDAVLSRPR